MSIKRTPLGHKRRGEARRGEVPVNSEDYRIGRARQGQQRQLDRRIDEARQGQQRRQEYRIDQAREGRQSTSWTGKREFQAGTSRAQPSFNPTSSDRRWDAWKAGGG